ncbi:MAG: CoB--CoM heterodisulfide reductase iron-sulfur subunit B family protein [Spirochaetes bacterium]|nr:CoB--CoM heterodisulfide reductase iron-sulfur subunit B family protein [Spirochaetota bacterium]
MKVSYYPGCSLSGTGKEYGESTVAALKILGTEAVELNDWSCCGASSAHSAGKEFAVELAARNLLIAQDAGLDDFVIPCSACFQRTKVAEYALKNHPESYPDLHYKGGLDVQDLLSFVYNKIGLEAIKKVVKKELNGLKAVAYYGCQSLRHPEVTGAKNYENPTQMDEILKVLGADVLTWSYKTDCCGGSLGISQPDILRTLVGKLYDKALEVGAECIVTCCPLCMANLDMYQDAISKKFNKQYNMPVFYFTELIALAAGEKDAVKWFKSHVADSVKLLKEKKLI